MKRFGYIWVTAVLFVGSLIGHWILGWMVFVKDQQAHQQAIELGEYVATMGRDTLENWQSEFLQLIWQVAGLRMLLCVGSPQSKEGDDRREEKLDALLRKLDPTSAEVLLRELEAKYPKK
jgi:hypothetical protein